METQESGYEQLNPIKPFISEKNYFFLNFNRKTFEIKNLPEMYLKLT